MFNLIASSSSSEAVKEGAKASSDLIFGGAITVQQFIIILAGVTALLLAFKLLRKVGRIVVSVIITVVMCVNFGLLSPDSVTDVAKYIADNGTKAIEAIGEKTKNIKIDKDALIQIYDGKDWIGIDEIKRMIVKEKQATLLLNDDTTVLIEDEAVIELLKLIRK